MREILTFTLAGLFFVGCSTVQTYKPIVDPSSVKDSTKFTGDLNECQVITDNVDYSNEENRAAIKGGLTGVGTVGAGAAVIASSGGIVLASVALPLAAIAGGVGAVTSKNRKSKEEQELRAIVFNKCLENRGYEVLSKK